MTTNVLVVTDTQPGEVISVVTEEGNSRNVQVGGAEAASGSGFSAAVNGSSPTAPDANTWAYLLAGLLAPDTTSPLWSYDAGTGKLTYSGPDQQFLISFGAAFVPAIGAGASQVQLYLDKNDTFVGTTNTPTGPFQLFNLAFPQFPQPGLIQNILALTAGDTITVVFRQDTPPSDFSVPSGYLTLSAVP